MGRRPGSTTKSGRFMNPADQERKSMRQKELKRNKKQRTMVRHAILKSKDVDEIIENLKRLDEQGEHCFFHLKHPTAIGTLRNVCSPLSSASK